MNCQDKDSPPKSSICFSLIASSTQKRLSLLEKSSLSSEQIFPQRYLSVL